MSTLVEAVSGEMGVGVKNNIIKRASSDQAFAADPNASAFVSANAGTGKTKLLTDRVLRLLLSGAPADGILCVTYTRTAAAEMRNRIFRRLAHWATMSDADLYNELAEMGVVEPGPEVTKRARSLFAEILDSDDGPRVETVHSFCQSILRRFPIEAGVAPHIELADDIEQGRLKTLARQNILERQNPELLKSVLMIAEITSEEQAGDIADNFVNMLNGLDSPDCFQEIQSHFKHDLGLENNKDSQRRIGSRLDKIDIDSIKLLASALINSGSKIHIARAKNIELWLSQPVTRRHETLNYLYDALFSRGRIRKNLTNKVVLEKFPKAEAVQNEIISIIEPLLAQYTGELCRERTLALYQYGIAFYQEYSRLKADRGLLDYNDLIVCTNKLLMLSEAAQWVAWKLDRGIQHLLIDEAQDTSPDQWFLLRQLSDVFFESENVDEWESKFPQRSVFAVGDFKQSIFSFQGANPLVMTKNRNEIADRAKNAKVDFRDISLSVSFRSTRPILDVVNAVIPNLSGVSDFIEHQNARADEGGFVEILPLIKEDRMSGVAPEATAASRLAKWIKGWLGSRQLSSGKLIQAGDILILMRKRGWFFDLLLGALQTEGILVAGADRMKLAEQIEIQDLMALGDVMHLNDDDLQLASVLRSPLFSIDENLLFELAYDRGARSLFSRLIEHCGSNTQLGLVADQFVLWQKIADHDSVFGFFSHVLINGGREKFRRQLGSSVDESLDHFLSLAQKFSLGGGASLLQFTTMIRKSGGEVKRDMDSVGSDEVRLMTIHGAKGLEAPIVVLPDMLRPRQNNERLTKSVDGRFVYWLPPASGVQPEFIVKARQKAELLRAEEENRVLYVALTRARDGLIIGGWEKANGVRVYDGSDYQRLRDAVASMPRASHQNGGGIILANQETIHTLKRTAMSKKALPKDNFDDFEVDWLWKEPLTHGSEKKLFRPSEISSNSKGLTGCFRPINKEQQYALAYGRLAHRMLEILPGVSPKARHKYAAEIARSEIEVPGPLMRELTKQVTLLIECSKLAPLFGNGALTEVPIHGTVGNHVVTGRIDRLYVDSDRVIIAEFKTGTKSSGKPPLQYCQQLSLYHALLKQIYPDRQIHCWIVWIENCQVQEVDSSARKSALARFFSSE